MEKINGYYVDDNNNKWSGKTYTKKQALKYSDTLFMCCYCTDCINCSFCRGCDNCRDCDNCFYCENSINCKHSSYLEYCRNCINCSDCSDWKKNPKIYSTSKIGSRKEQTYFYFDKKRIQVMCGCFSGNLIEFEKAVNETHGNNKYAKQYNKQIKIVKYLQDQI